MPLKGLQSGNIQFDQRDGIGHVTLCRPETKNALTLMMYRDLTAIVRYVAQTEALRCLCVTGAAGQFTSGNDLRDFLEHSKAAGESSPLKQFIYAVLEFPKPLLAAVEGVAYGIGTTLLLHCDYVAGHVNASFCLPFVSLGLVPEFGSSILLPELVGPVRARQWLLGGEVFSASDAHAAGLIQDVSPEAQALMIQKAYQFAAQAPRAQIITKAMLKQGRKEWLLSAIETEFDAFTQALAGAEFQEAVTAFFAKRPAQFNGDRT